MVGEFVIPEDTDGNSFVEYRNLCELDGFDVSGPIAVADMMARVGAGEYRVSAYGFEPTGLRWEVTGIGDGHGSCAWARNRRDRGQPTVFADSVSVELPSGTPRCSGS
jgi:hypothetical protein